MRPVGGLSRHTVRDHRPHLERLGRRIAALDVLARQRIDLQAPPHPFVQQGHETFDALLQSRPETFPGTLLVSDTTLWSSTAGGAGESAATLVERAGRTPS